MISRSSMFWCAAVASLLWCGNAYIGAAVSASYHPMAAKGDLLYPLRFWVIALPMLTATAMFLLWIWKRPLTSRIYSIGLVVLALASLLPFLPNIDSGYRQTYWIGEKRYEIPWRYHPRGGSQEPGGKSFAVVVSSPKLEPDYSTSDDKITITIAADFDERPWGESINNLCTKYFSSNRCQWRRGETVYSASGSAKLLPTDNAEFFNSVADLLDSFEVPSSQ